MGHYYGGGWWYGAGWWWWWMAFWVIFFILPLGYGWGYRGWGPWYRRSGRSPRVRPSSTSVGTELTPAEVEAGWGCLGIALWIILVIAIFWLIAALGWGGRWAG